MAQRFTQRTQSFVIFIVFIILVIVATKLVVQSFKEIPQKIILLFEAITLTSYLVFKNKKLFSILLFVLIFFMLFINFFELLDLITTFIKPDRGWVEFNGERHRTVDMNWAWETFIVAILSASALSIYIKNLRNLKFEFYFIVFAIIANFIFILANI